MNHPGLVACLALWTCSCAGTAPRPAVAPQVPPREWERLTAAEDARLSTPADMEVVQRALGSDNARVRAMAVRALGRSERAEFGRPIAPLLLDSSGDVVVAAAHALALVTRDTASGWVRQQLLAALRQPDASAPAAAAMLESIGRLHADAAAAHEVAGRLAGFIPHDGDVRTGALRGLYFLALQPAARAGVARAAGDALRSAVASRSTRAAAAHERRLAVATLAAARAADEPILRAALEDPEPQVRREAAAAAATLADTSAAGRVVRAAAGDEHPAVRYDALRVYAARLPASGGCAFARTAVADTSTNVALLAIDLLGTTCRSPAHAALLDSVAATLPRDAGGWHAAAHAIVALAATDVQRARPHVRALAQHPSGFARTYAARAAGVIADTALLHQLARDTSANVRTAAVTALHAVAGHDADSSYTARLTSDESELLMAAAAALEGTGDATVPARLLDALDRVSALRRETSRDARVALLARVQELGGAHLTQRVVPYLRDFDRAVAERAAAVLESWTGTRPAIAPQPLPQLPVPSFRVAEQLARSSFVLEMEDGGEIEIRLDPFMAPTNAARFARLARSGYYDGLTFHRVVPNFVVQGGSPGANEYAGDGPFTRDELGAPNWRGTVGLSTRGRDTGDAQFYINLIDNVRLDTDYTVFGTVVRGMDVVDRLMEGAVIRRVREEPG